MSILYVFLYLVCGLYIVRFLLPGQRPLYRAWLGLSLGIMLAMWLPALVAFVDAFSLRGHVIALVLLLVLTGISYFLRDGRTLCKADEENRNALRLLLYIALPLTILGFYLQYTHVLRPVEGALHVGQSTYGDLPLHLGIVTSLRDARFPAEYSIFPGERLSYPFLTDSLSTTFMLLGMPLRWAMIIPGTLMMAMVACGFVLLALRMAGNRRVAALAALLLFINGGLGFLYSFDMAGVSLGVSGSNELQYGTWLARLKTIFYGWYQTPVNHAEFSTYNLRWSNIIADMFIPQRTFLGGWTLLLPCIYLLFDGLQEEKRNARQMALLGIMAGALPLVHTHSFLALVLLSFGWLLRDMAARRDWKPWLLFVTVAGILSLPQLFAFTFRQASGSGNFLSFQFNWVNGEGGMKDGYLWFYLKNIGLPFLLLILSVFEKNREYRFIYLGALCIFLPAEFIRFQPNSYDNNKLFYVWYALCLVPIADYALKVYAKLKGLRARKLIAVLACLAFFLSGGLSIAREAVSDYKMFSENDTKAAQWVESETDSESMFMAGMQHINPVSSLAGRHIVCGPALWLYYHGFNLHEREQDIRAFYLNPKSNTHILKKYGADYVLLGSYERTAYSASDSVFDALFPRVYADAQGEIIIYRAEAGN